MKQPIVNWKGKEAIVTSVSWDPFGQVEFLYLYQAGKSIVVCNRPVLEPCKQDSIYHADVEKILQEG